MITEKGLYTNLSGVGEGVRVRQQTKYWQSHRVVYIMYVKLYLIINQEETIVVRSLLFP